MLRRNSDVVLALVLLALTGYAAWSTYSVVRFDRERIEVWVAPGQVQVAGLYHYRNPFSLPALLSLGVPFPVDAEHPQPGTYAIASADEAGDVLEPILPHMRNGELRFRLLMMPREERWIRVDYVQASRVLRASYILRSTREWHRPLAAGKYVLHLSPGLELAGSNYALAGQSEGEASSYSFFKTDFYPDEDWAFSWREAESIRAPGSAP